MNATLRTKDRFSTLSTSIPLTLRAYTCQLNDIQEGPGLPTSSGVWGTVEKCD